MAPELSRREVGRDVSEGARPSKVIAAGGVAVGVVTPPAVVVERLPPALPDEVTNVGVASGRDGSGALSGKDGGEELQSDAAPQSRRGSRRVKGLPESGGRGEELAGRPPGLEVGSSQEVEVWQEGEEPKLPAERPPTPRGREEGPGSEPRAVGRSCEAGGVVRSPGNANLSVDTGDRPSGGAGSLQREAEDVDVLPPPLSQRL